MTQNLNEIETLNRQGHEHLKTFMHHMFMNANQKDLQHFLSSAPIIGDSQRWYSKSKGRLLEKGDREFSMFGVLTGILWGNIDPLSFFKHIEANDRNYIDRVLSLRRKPINYDLIKADRYNTNVTGKYNIVVPIRENDNQKIRLNHANTLLVNLYRLLKDRPDWNLTFYIQENSDDPIYESTVSLSKKLGFKNFSAYRTPKRHPIYNTDMFMNKSLCFNHVLREMNFEWQVNHDVDLLVTEEFINGIENQNSPTWYQPFYGGRVVYMSEKKTTKLVTQYSKGEQVDLLDYVPKTQGGSHIPPMADLKAPGGSLAIRRENMLSVGGFDPQIVYGYAPEDSIFWSKLELKNNPNLKQQNVHHAGNGALYCHDEKAEALHMWHPVGYCDVDNMFVPTIMSVWLRYTTDYEKRNRFINSLENIL